MAAVAAGVRHVQATINGYGERAGNANMVSILANLALKTPHELVPAGGGTLAGADGALRSVAEIANQNPNDYQPYVGRSAFAHKGGVHGAAVAKVERRYQHIDPAAVGNVGRLVVSELGGRANTRIRAEQLGHQLEGVVDPKVLSDLVKQLESEGLAFEGAEASFELLIRRHQTGYVAPFRIVDYTCLVEQRSGRELLAEATVKVEVDGEILHTAADGNGPVNALDAALRKALGAFYPQLDDVHLIDYKVRILDGEAATAARTRVIIDSSDGAFHLVIPSMPGFGFSTPLVDEGWTMARVARTYDQLMRRLGYSSYSTAATAGRWSRASAILDPEGFLGAHVLQLFSFPSGDPAEFERFGPKEYAALEFLGWFQSVGGYNQMNGTRPQTIAAALADSPVGQLAYNELFENFGNGTSLVSPEQVLTQVSLYWLTNSMATAARYHYAEQRSAGQEGGAEPQVSHGRTGVAVFKDDFQTIRPLAERDNDNIVHWSEFDRGGHYAALEVPELVVGDLRAFFAQAR